jgi:hypothetical protein
MSFVFTYQNLKMGDCLDRISIRQTYTKIFQKMQEPFFHLLQGKDCIQALWNS